MEVEVGKYYLTRDKKIVKVKHAEFCDNPISWVGVDDTKLEHLATCHYTYEKAKEIYKEELDNE